MGFVENLPKKSLAYEIELNNDSIYTYNLSKLLKIALLPLNFLHDGGFLQSQ